MKYMKLFLFLALALSLGIAWVPVRSTVAQSGANFGDPLPGLSASDQTNFTTGKTSFQQIESVSPDGLGPIFNARGCGECHSFPTTGGAGAANEVRFGRSVNGVFDPQASKGGSLLQLFAIKPECQELVPSDANRVGFRQTTPLFGAGLVEAIPDADIVHYANFQAATFPGQAGQINSVTSVSDGRSHVGRFGWKSQQALLLDFSGDAYNNEMGITNRLFPHENLPNTDVGQPNYATLLAKCNPAGVTEPNDQPDSSGVADIDRFANFMRFLGAPPTLPSTAQIQQGRQVFQNIGCAICHKPSFRAGNSPDGPHAGIVGVTVNAFSDFLLHDVGTGDGVAAAPGTENKFRTAPLWGLRASAPYLHNGSAATIRQAILAHHGQAEFAENNFELLSDADRAALLAFLNSI